MLVIFDNKYYFEYGNKDIEISFTDGAFDYVKINNDKYDNEDVKFLGNILLKVDELQKKQHGQGE